MPRPRFVIEKLSHGHDRSVFDCGIEELNDYLKKYSGQHERRGISRTYVAVEERETQVLGYYSISSGAVAFDTVPDNLPDHPVPVALIGRLAVDKSARGHGLGEMLLVHALRSAQRASEVVGIYAVVVDAWDETAKKFYLKYGFNELKDDRLHLYLSMKVIRQLSTVKPVPIPNTEVKPLGADGTARAIAWESRKPPGLLNEARSGLHLSGLFR